MPNERLINPAEIARMRSQQQLLSHDRADVSVEQIAYERSQREALVELPKTPADMLRATLDDAGQGSLSELAIRFARNEEATMLVHIIDQRVRRFFVQADAQPSAYAQMLHHVATGNRDAQHLRILNEWQTFFVQEVNPLLRELYSETHAEENGFATEDEFWAMLDAGEIDSQRTTSVFGVLRHLEDILEAPYLNIAEVAPVRRIAVADPLSAESKKEYWSVRQKIHELYGDATLPEMIASRTESLIYQLGQAAAEIPTDDTAMEETRMAYAVVANWAGQHAKAFRHKRIQQPVNFATEVRRLHFGQGKPEEVITLFNAVELVKRDNPELYMRMAGIGRTYDHGTRGDTELGESELFGSVFHLALYRSLDMSIRSDETASALFHNRVQSLTQLDQEQPLLEHLSQDQLEQLEDITRQLHADSLSGSNVEKTTSAIMAFAATRRLFEAKLPKMLKAIQTQEWSEQREYLIESMRLATPVEFMKLVQGTPIELWDDAELDQLFQTRIAQHLRPYENTFDIPGQETDLYYILPRGKNYPPGRRTIRNFAEFAQFIHHDEHFGEAFDDYNRERLREALWLSASDEAILSQEFFSLLTTYANLRHSKKRHRDETQKKQEFITQLITIHSDITADRWIQSFQKIRKDKSNIKKSLISYTVSLRKIYIDHVQSTSDHEYLENFLDFADTIMKEPQ